MIPDATPFPQTTVSEETGKWEDSLAMGCAALCRAPSGGWEPDMTSACRPSVRHDGELASSPPIVQECSHASQLMSDTEYEEEDLSESNYETASETDEEDTVERQEQISKLLLAKLEAQAQPRPSDLGDTPV